MSNRLRDSERFLSAHRSDDPADAEEGNEVSEIPVTSVNLKVCGEDTAETQANEKVEVEMSFLSSKTRAFFVLQSNVKILACLLETCLTGSYTCLDKTMSCPSCNVSIDTENVSSKQTRNDKLHTLYHGSITISVTDIRCPKYDRRLLYDGANDAVFLVSKQDTFTRELLDAWVHDVFAMAGTCRDAFSSWMTKVSKSSATFRRIGMVHTLNIQLANGAFTSFFMKLRLPRKEDIHRMFSCNKFETEFSNGERILDAVVMDGTAMGILKNYQNLTAEHARLNRPEILLTDSTLCEILNIVNL